MQSKAGWVGGSTSVWVRKSYCWHAKLIYDLAWHFGLVMGDSYAIALKDSLAM